MVDIRAERCTGELDGDFVVFLIGMRINRWWRVHKWLPIARAMGDMLAELARQPELGLLHARPHIGFPNLMFVQYWRSFAQLEAYATARDKSHLPAWSAFNRAIANNGDVGIWHETYVIGAGDSESFYVNMPPFGLGAAGTLAPAKGRRANARGRLSAAGAGQSEGDAS